MLDEMALQRCGSDLDLAVFHKRLFLTDQYKRYYRSSREVVDNQYIERITDTFRFVIRKWKLQILSQIYMRKLTKWSLGRLNQHIQDIWNVTFQQRYTKLLCLIQSIFQAW